MLTYKLEIIRQLIALYFLIFPLLTTAQIIHLPIDVMNRHSLDQIQLTEIGEFGLVRKARPAVKQHLHTGIDIKRPGKNYDYNPIFPISDGVVISKRDDGPYAQLIIEHIFKGQKFWTVYEHIAGIEVKLNETVYSDRPIARFMNRDELNKYGWQFDHFHLEVLRVTPYKLKIVPTLPERRFQSYTLICYNEEDLLRYFYHPMKFFQKYF